MKNGLRLMTAIFSFLILFACSGSTDINGVYVFDSSRFEAALKGIDDPILKDLPAEIFQKTLEGLKTYELEIAGEKLTVRFMGEEFSGSLQPQGKTEGSLKFHFVPDDDGQQEDTATILIHSKQLTIDPGKKEIDKLYFVKK